MKKQIERVYTGQVAANYDAVRGNSARWARESEVIEPLLRTIPPGTKLIDVAAGTGRWLDIYRELGLDAALIDSSSDMLAVAREKALAFGYGIRTVCEPATSPAPYPAAETAVVTNFFNWIPLDEVETVLQKMIAAGVSRMIFMITYGKEAAKPIDRGWGRLRIGIDNIRSRLGVREKGHYHIHAEKAVRRLLTRLRLEVHGERLIVDGRYKRNVMIDAAPPEPPAITTFGRCVVRGDEAEIDGKRYAVNRGHWAFYVPALQMKVLYAVDGKVHCTHSTAPDRNALSSGQAVVQDRRYSLQDWRDALAKSVVRRAAENYVAASRLAVAGIGPAVRGCAVVDDLAVEGAPVRGPAAGIVVDDLTTYAEKRSTTKRQVSAAGVQLDRLRSATRAQIRGYVSDLNSVVGVMPVNAAGEVAIVEREIAKRMPPTPQA